MYYPDEENDYDSDNDDNFELNSEYFNIIKFDNDIEIINSYKQVLLKEPEFIGIKNICSAEILYIIQSTITGPKEKLLKNKKVYYLSEEQEDIFINMYHKLNIKYNENILNSVCNKILNKIYC